MDPLTIAAASGMRARMESLDLLANNLANAETAGYKSDREFYDLFVAPEATGGFGGNLATLPVVQRNWIDFSQGALRSTGNPLDVALSGKGFIGVDGPSGPLYTRKGTFQLSAAGMLVSSEGHAVRKAGGGQFQLQPEQAVEISRNGEVRQAGQILGRIEVVDFADASGLEKLGGACFRPVAANVSPAPAGNTEVHQGKLEGSNLATAEAAVRLVSVMRQFEMLQKAITLGADMNRKAVEEVARVGS